MATATATSVEPAAKVINEIERLFGPDSWMEVAEYDISQLDYTRRVQVREVSHYTPRESVERFMVQMSESVFPPILVTQDGWIVDGNTRVEARIRRKEKFTPAIVVQENWTDASRKTKSLLVALAATLNANAGQPLSAKEARAVSAELIALDWKTEQIGRAIGLKASAVGQVRREIAAEAKLKRVGLDSNGGLKGASLRALGAENVLALNDVPYRELAQLAADAGFNASEITTTAKQARETGADDAALEMIEKLRVENEDRIREQDLTGTAKPPVARQLRQHLGFVNKFVGREQELLETNPAVNDVHVESLTTAVGILTEVLKLQGGNDR